MQIKVNQSTNNRPEGERILDAPAVLVEIQQYIHQIMQEDAWHKNDRNAITVFKTPGITVVINALHSGAEMKDVEVDGLLMLQVLEGEITVMADDEGEKRLREKEILILHPCFRTNILAEKDTVMLLSNILIGDQRVKSDEAVL
jgi:hypothetical protein